MASLTVAIQQLAIVSSEVTTILNTVRYYTHTHTHCQMIYLPPPVSFCIIGIVVTSI